MDGWLSVLPGTLTLVALVSLAIAVFALVAGVAALRRRRRFKGLVRLWSAAIFGLIVALIAFLALGVRGYQAMTKEETVAVVVLEPTQHQRFIARVHFPDGRKTTFRFAGDQLYLDARVLKWKPWANMLGLHTAYELDRVAGRYRLIEEERNKPRTLHSLAQDRTVDLFHLRRRFEALSPFYDAEYGSATFVEADQPAVYDIRLSTTGLLARRRNPRSQ